MSSRNSSRLFHVAGLQRQSPAAAQQFASDFLNKHNGFEVALDPDSNEPLDVAQTIDTAQRDLEDRANNDLPQRESERRRMKRSSDPNLFDTTRRWSTGSLFSGATRVDFTPYTMDELEIVSNSLTSKKKVFLRLARCAQSCACRCQVFASCSRKFKFVRDSLPKFPHPCSYLIESRWWVVVW